MNARSHPEYPLAKGLMETMVEHSQKPGEGNIELVQSLQKALRSFSLRLRTFCDPVYSDRKLLTVDIGDPDGRQTLVATSHGDVVGIEGQHWSTNPWKLREEDGRWFGRGTCDTHGTGVSLLLAGLREEVSSALRAARARVTLLFTYDEEATSPDFSMRGARLAAGLLGSPSVISTPYFVVGEPTEIDGAITPMRGHKGRLLAHFRLEAPEAGHVSQPVQNALMAGAQVIHEISEYAHFLQFGSKNDEEAHIFDPPYTSVQVSAADVKKGDYSSTPANARFTVDMRTLPFVHQLRIDEMIDLIASQKFSRGEKVSVEIEKQAPGSMTQADSPIVRAAEEAAGIQSKGFNGGHEGRILCNSAKMDGVAIGPGSLAHAHMPDERIEVASIFRGADIYAALFRRSIELPPTAISHD